MSSGGHREVTLPCRFAKCDFAGDKTHPCHASKARQANIVFGSDQSDQIREAISEQLSSSQIALFDLYGRILSGSRAAFIGRGSKARRPLGYPRGWFLQTVAYDEMQKRELAQMLAARG